MTSIKAMSAALSPIRMEARRLGSSPLSVPVIGLGTWRYTAGVEPLHAGIDYGASFIDTAEIYGTEEIVGQAIRGRRDRVILATKAAPRHFRRPDLIAAAESSLKRLGTDYIDLYQLHWPNYKVPLSETMQALADLVDAGKIRYIGVSNFSVRELQKAQSALPKYRIVSNQVRYSLIERTIEQGLLQYCQRNDITVIAYSPLGMDFARMRAADGSGSLSRASESARKTEAQVALNWVIRNDHVITIPRASTVPHAIDACGASGWRISAREYEILGNEIPYRCIGWAEAAKNRWKRYVAQSIGRQL